MRIYKYTMNFNLYMIPFKQNFIYLTLPCLYSTYIHNQKLDFQLQLKLSLFPALNGPDNNIRKKLASLRFFFFLFYLLNNFFSKKIQSNFLLYFKRYKSIKRRERILNTLQRVFKRKRIKVKPWLKINQFLCFLIKTLEHKDSDFFLNNLKLFFFFLPLFYYKKIFTIILTFFRVFQNIFFLKYSISGIFFSLRGKLGLKGGLKKKRLLYKYKKTSFSNTLLRLNYNQSFLQTPVGSIGLKFFIFY